MSNSLKRKSSDKTEMDDNSISNDMVNQTQFNSPEYKKSKISTISPLTPIRRALNKPLSPKNDDVDDDEDYDQQNLKSVIKSRRILPKSNNNNNNTNNNNDNNTNTTATVTADGSIPNIATKFVIKRVNIPEIIKWSKFIKYPTNFVLWCPGMAVDEKNNKLYLYDSNAQITIIDIKSKQFNICWAGDGLFGDTCPPMINIKGITHSITLFKSDNEDEQVPDISARIVWSEKNDYVQIIEQYHDIFSFERFIYIQSKDVLLLFGCNGPSFMYSLKTGARNKLKNINHINWRNGVLTNDEKYIIAPSNDGIYALKMRFSAPKRFQYKLQKSAVSAPKGNSIFDSFECIITGRSKDEILVNGYIKKIFNSEQFMHLQMLPIYLIKLISSWYIEEVLHLIDRNDGSQEKNHFAISIKEIVSSLSDC